MSTHTQPSAPLYAATYCSNATLPFLLPGEREQRRREGRDGLPRSLPYSALHCVLPGPQANSPHQTNQGGPRAQLKVGAADTDFVCLFRLRLRSCSRAGWRTEMQPPPLSKRMFDKFDKARFAVLVPPAGRQRHAPWIIVHQSVAERPVLPVSVLFVSNNRKQRTHRTRVGPYRDGSSVNW
jgi:hypothetical protein